MIRTRSLWVSEPNVGLAQRCASDLRKLMDRASRRQS